MQYPHETTAVYAAADDIDLTLTAELSVDGSIAATRNRTLRWDTLPPLITSTVINFALQSLGDFQLDIVVAILILYVAWLDLVDVPARIFLAHLRLSDGERADWGRFVVSMVSFVSETLLALLVQFTTTEVVGLFSGRYTNLSEAIVFFTLFMATIKSLRVYIARLEQVLHSVVSQKEEEEETKSVPSTPSYTYNVLLHR